MYCRRIRRSLKRNATVLVLYDKKYFANRMQYLFSQYFKQSVVNKTIIKCYYVYLLFDMNKEEDFDDIGTDRK